MFIPFFFTQNEIKVLNYMVEKHRTKGQKIFQPREIYRHAIPQYNRTYKPIESLEKKNIVKIFRTPGRLKPNVILNIDFLRQLERNQRLDLEDKTINKP